MNWHRTIMAIRNTVLAICLFLLVTIGYFAVVLEKSVPAGSEDSPEPVQSQKMDFFNPGESDPGEIAAKIQVEIDSLNSWLQMGEDYPNMYVYKTWIDGLELRFIAIDDLYKQLLIADPGGEYLNSIERFEEARDRILFGMQSGDQVMINIGREILNASGDK